MTLKFIKYSNLNIDEFEEGLDMFSNIFNQ